MIKLNYIKDFDLNLTSYNAPRSDYLFNNKSILIYYISIEFQFIPISYRMQNFLLEYKAPIKKYKSKFYAFYS